MKKIIISIAWIFIFSCLGATTYFVSTTGNDANSGTFENLPLLTIAKALTKTAPGDYIYVKGGVYYLSATIYISLSGTFADSCFLLSYPGERAVLDFSATADGIKGMSISGSYWHIKGFDIKKAGSTGMYINIGGNNVIDHCSFSENKNVGLRLGNKTHDNKIINCDSYYNSDPPDYGDADGFACALDVGTNNYFYGCRAWLNVDDGFDGYLRGGNDMTTTLENCWAWQNGYFKDGTDAGPNANGNGFKLGGSDDKLLMHNFILRNCLAFDNKSKGFDQNANMGNMILQNCTGYRNVYRNYSISMVLPTGKIAEVKNCIAVDGKVTLGSFVTQEKNSWMSPFSVTTADFKSLDTTGAGGKRKSNGNLPDVNFVRLAAGSDLIDGGSLLGNPYIGSAPDLGAFEYNPNSTISVNPLKSISNPSIFRLGSNPVNEYLELYFDEPSTESLSCKIYDIRGREVWVSDLSLFQSGEGKINARIAHLPSAIYILRISNAGYSQSARIIKF
jgi:hypothetical protein